MAVIVFIAFIVLMADVYPKASQLIALGCHSLGAVGSELEFDLLSQTDQLHTYRALLEVRLQRNWIRRI